MQTTGACQVVTSSAASGRCLRSCMRAVARPCCCTSCCTALTLTRQGNSVRLPSTTLALLALTPSSRRQRDTRTASAKTTCTGWLLSAGIRQCPSKIRAVVTQFVTQTGDDHVRRPLQQGEHRYESVTSDRANRPVVPTKPRAIGCSSPGCNPGRGSGGCPGRRCRPC
jgi:hypothetical protein